MAMDPVSTSEVIAGSGKAQAPRLVPLLAARRFLPIFLAQSLGALNVALLIGALAAGFVSSPDARLALAFGAFLAPVFALRGHRRAGCRQI